jgi:hypothetical protein
MRSGAGQGAERSGMGLEYSANRKARRAKARKRQDARWAAKSSDVTVQKMCRLEDCDGSCGDWHRL